MKNSKCYRRSKNSRRLRAAFAFQREGWQVTREVGIGIRVASHKAQHGRDIYNVNFQHLTRDYVRPPALFIEVPEVGDIKYELFIDI